MRTSTNITAMADHLFTLRDFLRMAVSAFRKAGLVHAHGVTTAYDDAAFLLLEGLHLPVDQLEPWLDARLLPEERQRLAALIEARVSSRKPSAYLVNKAYIQSVPFYVDERVIVPRSYLGEMLMGDSFDPDEGLVGGALGDVTRILDLCTGSGCLAILAAMRFPQASIDAVDLSADALAVARRNVDDHGLQDRVQLVQGDLFKPIAGRTYDLIIANPPYVAADVVQAFPAEYAAEPQMAHLGGADGFDLVHRILQEAPAFLTPGGGLICEFGEDQAVLEAAHPAVPFLWLDSAESEGEVFWLKKGHKGWSAS